MIWEVYRFWTLYCWTLPLLLILLMPFVIILVLMYWGDLNYCIVLVGDPLLLGGDWVPRLWCHYRPFVTLPVPTCWRCHWITVLWINFVTLCIVVCSYTFTLLFHWNWLPITCWLPAIARTLTVIYLVALWYWWYNHTLIYAYDAHLVFTHYQLTVIITRWVQDIGTCDWNCTLLMPVGCDLAGDCYGGWLCPMQRYWTPVPVMGNPPFYGTLPTRVVFAFSDLFLHSRFLPLPHLHVYHTVCSLHVYPIRLPVPQRKPTTYGACRFYTPCCSLVYTPLRVIRVVISPSPVITGLLLPPCLFNLLPDCTFIYTVCYWRWCHLDLFRAFWNYVVPPVAYHRLIPFYYRIPVAGFNGLPFCCLLIRSFVDVLWFWCHSDRSLPWTWCHSCFSGALGARVLPVPHHTCSQHYRNLRSKFHVWRVFITAVQLQWIWSLMMITFYTHLHYTITLHLPFPLYSRLPTFTWRLPVCWTFTFCSMSLTTFPITTWAFSPPRGGYYTVNLLGYGGYFVPVTVMPLGLNRLLPTVLHVEPIPPLRLIDWYGRWWVFWFTLPDYTLRIVRGVGDVTVSGVILVLLFIWTCTLFQTVVITFTPLLVFIRYPIPRCLLYNYVTQGKLCNFVRRSTVHHHRCIVITTPLPYDGWYCCSWTITQVNCWVLWNTQATHHDYTNIIVDYRWQYWCSGDWKFCYCCCCYATLQLHCDWYSIVHCYYYDTLRICWYNCWCIPFYYLRLGDWVLLPLTLLMIQVFWCQIRLCLHTCRDCWLQRLRYDCCCYTILYDCWVLLIDCIRLFWNCWLAPLLRTLVPVLGALLCIDRLWRYLLCIGNDLRLPYYILRIVLIAFVPCCCYDIACITTIVIALYLGDTSADCNCWPICHWPLIAITFVDWCLTGVVGTFITGYPLFWLLIRLQRLGELQTPSNCCYSTILVL